LWLSSDYDYNEIFAGTDGWDLQYLVNVNWYLPKIEIVFNKPLLVRHTLRACKNQTVIERIKSEEFELQLPTADFRKLKVPNEIAIVDISQSLIDFGIRIQDADNIASTIERIIKLTNWYHHNDPDVFEHEIRTFLIVPLLISLGWGEQKLKIEYNNIDVAVFEKSFTDRTYKTPPKIIIETKRFDDGLSFTAQQAEQYSKNYSTCKMLIVTNGFRYKIIEKEEEKFAQTAYLNLLNLREHDYLSPTIGGVVMALLKMSNFG
jgi:Type I restriction enzyme R protein N terminus (HSDR_N)